MDLMDEMYDEPSSNLAQPLLPLPRSSGLCPGSPQYGLRNRVVDEPSTSRPQPINAIPGPSGLCPGSAQSGFQADDLFDLGGLHEDNAPNFDDPEAKEALIILLDEYERTVTRMAAEKEVIAWRNIEMTQSLGDKLNEAKSRSKAEENELVKLEGEKAKVEQGFEDIMPLVTRVAFNEKKCAESLKFETERYLAFRQAGDERTTESEKRRQAIKHERGFQCNKLTEDVRFLATDVIPRLTLSYKNKVLERDRLHALCRQLEADSKR